MLNQIAVFRAAEKEQLRAHKSEMDALHAHQRQSEHRIGELEMQVEGLTKALIAIMTNGSNVDANQLVAAIRKGDGNYPSRFERNPHP